MQLPPPQPIGNRHSMISGNVTIHSSAAIAPSVLLQADPDSELIIGAGVCIGAGAVIHAHGGTLELEVSVNLGSEVLVVGHGRIRANACIGSKATLINPDVPAASVVGWETLVGDESRSVVEEPAVEAPPVNQTPMGNGWIPLVSGPPIQNGQVSPVNPPPVVSGPPVQNRQAASINPSPLQNGQMSSQQPAPIASGPPMPGAITPSEPAEPGPIVPPNLYNQTIYGKAAVERLLNTMFPHRQTLNQPLNPNGTEPPASGGSP